MSQGSLFGPDAAPVAKAADDAWRRMQVLVTVKAAPNPSAAYGETVCVAGLSMDLDAPGWVRLYPINFRDLESAQRFRKYDIVSIKVKPARNDPRVESWKPDMTSLVVQDYLKPWKRRRPLVEPYVEESMCEVLNAVRSRPPARSLAAVRPASVQGIDLESHPGWTADEQDKINRYVGQIDMFGTDRTALEAPRFRGWYRYKCTTTSCGGHRQGILDWEFVALQRRLVKLGDDALKVELRKRYFGEMCAAGKDVVFFVGNQAKRQHVFGVVGVYWPPR
ncbi:hypothetical protein [Lentzea sp. NPDC003310]|uniref:hypothetical protein n=1 Tax=Lentzea sp. NPDC003310 TaxID=3154447 RepID=UPI0033BCAB64